MNQSLRTHFLHPSTGYPPPSLISLNLFEYSASMGRQLTSPKNLNYPRQSSIIRTLLPEHSLHSVQIHTEPFLFPCHTALVIFHDVDILSSSSLQDFLVYPKNATNYEGNEGTKIVEIEKSLYLTIAKKIKVLTTKWPTSLHSSSFQLESTYYFLSSFLALTYQHANHPKNSKKMKSLNPKTIETILEETEKKEAAFSLRPRTPTLDQKKIAAKSIAPLSYHNESECGPSISHCLYKGYTFTSSNSQSWKDLLQCTLQPPPPPPCLPQRSATAAELWIGAISSGIQPGLTMVVGPPRTGKTNIAVKILDVLYHNCPSQRILIITHSNQALNDLFEKIMKRDVPACYLLRLGQGEQELATDLDFSRQGRYTCETAGYFWLLHVYSLCEQFLAACSGNEDKPTFVQDLFTGESFEKDMRAAKGCFRHLKTMFQELEECRAFELLKSTADRANYLMTKQAKIVAMTCTHAALKRKDFLQLGFKYDNLLMEESAQILEIETFIPMLLQIQDDGYARLKRCILISDHHYHMDQILFTRFVRVGIPYIELNAQGRARPSIAQLYNWRYRELGDLPYVKEAGIFHKANAGFSYDYQLVDVPDYPGFKISAESGETALSPWFYQNEGEAEYVVSVYMYMRLLGYPASKISILTTYNGQKLLIRDVINRRCVPYDFIGPPSKVSKMILSYSLVLTRSVGHLRDVRRLVVAMSRARLGLYVFCRRFLFEQCYELQPTFQLLLPRPDHLALNLNETTSFTDRHVADPGLVQLVSGVEEMSGIVNFKMHQVYQQKGQQDSTSQHQPMGTDMPANSHDANGILPPESKSEEATEMEVLENGQDGDLSPENNLKENADMDGDGGAPLQSSSIDENKME
ncbi:hypothetical protein PVL29_017200 [Vitis rotundifolia]|uniref:Intron-binding protein aquarius n=1 Tax=Vitis rotundifolia TaxID=103349 RepID=A0AA39DHH6_VITRO|nr:hypothetical protein PVL29_017200 [Vitis rotundifolia]